MHQSVGEDHVVALHQRWQDSNVGVVAAAEHQRLAVMSVGFAQQLLQRPIRGVFTPQQS